MSRDTYGGMDFEFENKTGPIDGRSPFAMLGQQRMQPPTTKKRTFVRVSEMGYGMEADCVCSRQLQRL